MTPEQKSLVDACLFTRRDPCVACRWRLNPNAQGATCARGAAPIFAGHVGHCTKFQAYEHE
jgi:hypothetical protein